MGACVTSSLSLEGACYDDKEAGQVADKARERCS